MNTVSAIEANREITRDYLKESGFEVVLTRYTRVPSDTGGYTTDSQELAPQIFALIGPQAGLRRSPEEITNVGEVANYNLSLLGHHNANVQDGDTFILDGGKYRVDFVFPDQYRARYETVAVVVYEGRAS